MHHNYRRDGSGGSKAVGSDGNAVQRRRRFGSFTSEEEAEKTSLRFKIKREVQKIGSFGLSGLEFCITVVRIDFLSSSCRQQLEKMVILSKSD